MEVWRASSPIRPRRSRRTAMTRPALAAARAVEVLNFLASHPGESFTLSELSRHLNLNMASGLSVLKALTDAGYVHRHDSHKTYSLGPALVARSEEHTSELQSLR